MIKEFFVSAGKDVALGFIGCSYWICLFVCMLSLIFYMVGSKKSGRVVSISFIIYVLTQALKLGIK